MTSDRRVPLSIETLISAIVFDVCVSAGAGVPDDEPPDVSAGGLTGSLTGVLSGTTGSGTLTGAPEKRSRPRPLPRLRITNAG